ncbi:MAG: fumarylacetoacetate hydrolase family protein [Acidobacteria bacterium]|nr:fumarylacetoacetate hydrolase family protein [Acidobacteriota bacterium]
MRIATVRGVAGDRSGVVTERDGQLFIAYFDTDRALPDLIAGGRLENVPTLAAAPITADLLAAPIPRPGKLLCLAANFREHIVESGIETVEHSDLLTQQVFLKPSTCLTGPEAPVALHSNNVAVGWEVELAVVIGRRGRNIPVESAMDHVFGYMVLNDLSERKLNSLVTERKTRAYDPFFDWLVGKWFDGFAPCGPWIVTADDIPDPYALPLRLWVNGELRQDGVTGDMIFNIAEQIAYTSSVMTLEPGDIISTGTPAGAGLGTGSKVLHPGDVVMCEVEGIGRLTTRIVAA